jgi:hypothetical protein
MPDNVQLNAEYSVAIEDKGLWPNLKMLPDGSIGAFIYNKPSHGYNCGDVELYISRDSGRSWQFRSQVSEHEDEPRCVRMNHAVGVNVSGHLVAIVSGWSEGRKAPILKSQICISPDNGLSWERRIWNINSEHDFVPYGDIVRDDEGNLTVAFYAWRPAPGKADFYVARSSDGGYNWEDPEYILSGYGEVTILRTENNKWFAVGRDVSRMVEYCNQQCAPDPLVLFVSDDGRKWRKKSVLTLPGQIPGHILELHDGRLLVTYGSRAIGLCGVQAMISSDGGESWSKPVILLNYNGPSDCGYPSTLELEDGRLLTAFYAGEAPEEGIFGLPLHPAYHMGCLNWKTDIFRK